jgi:hypothetical protein
MSQRNAYVTEFLNVPTPNHVFAIRDAIESAWGDRPDLVGSYVLAGVIKGGWAGDVAVDYAPYLEDALRTRQITHPFSLFVAGEDLLDRVILSWDGKDDLSVVPMARPL